MRPDSSDISEFFELVCAHFLARTGRGLVISSRDTELLLGWKTQGATTACVCGGIDEAVDSLSRTPKNLYACRNYIDARMKVQSNIYFDAPTETAPRAETPPSVEPAPTTQSSVVINVRDTVLNKLLNGQTSCHPKLAEVYREAASLVQDWEPSEVPSKVVELNTWMFDAAFSSLPEEEQKSIDDAITAQVGNHLKMMSQAAKAETISFRRQSVLVAEYGLIDLEST